MSERQLYPYPLTIIMDRYSGMSAGGRFTAWNKDPDEIPCKVFGADLEAISFWEEYHEDYADIVSPRRIIGIGDTPDEAVQDLIRKQQEKGVFCGV